LRKNQKLITDDIPSLIKQLAIPASTGMFFNTMYNVVDTFYAGLISTQAIAALSLSFMIFFLIIGTGYGFS
jgi:Na+-driven multidrug efflux pump